MRVFISSIISGFTDFRSAARRAVELTGNIPIMAEDFGARPDAPQAACLSGVRESDVYILVIGSRYGTRTMSGVAPTEEEFGEAQRLRLPILAFKTTEDIEPDQAEFVRRVSPAWEEGITYARFTSPDDLKEEVIRALSRPMNFNSGATVDASELWEWLTRISSDREDVGVALVFVPAARSRIVDISEIDNLGSVVGRLVAATGLVPDGSLHVSERAVEIGADVDRDRTYGVVEVRDDLSCGISVGLRNDPRDIGSMDFHYIDRARLLSALTQSLVQVLEIVRTIDNRNAIREGWIQCRLWGLRHREIADLPDESVTSFTFPPETADEMLFPSEPLPIRLKDLSDADRFAGTLLRALERQVADARRQRY